MGYSVRITIELVGVESYCIQIVPSTIVVTFLIIMGLTLLSSIAGAWIMREHEEVQRIFIAHKLLEDSSFIKWRLPRLTYFDYTVQFLFNLVNYSGDNMLPPNEYDPSSLPPNEYDPYIF